MGLVSTFWIVVVLLALWATVFAVIVPVRQAFLNGLIPSAQRATVLSSENLLSSAGGVVAQPWLGKVADAWSYGSLPAPARASAEHQRRTRTSHQRTGGPRNPSGNRD